MLFYIIDDIPCKEIEIFDLPSDFEGIFLELTLRKIKWLVFGGYNCRKENTYFLNHIGKVFDKFLGNYENKLLLGDFNSHTTEPVLRDFSDLYSLKNLFEEPTCNKSPFKPSSIDLILTNRAESFHESRALETSISDFHKMTITVLEYYFKKKSPIRIKYRSYKKFSDEDFRNDLSS